MSKVWKWLFLGLLALNLALISVVTVKIMTPVEMSPVSLPKGAAKIGKYSMSKEELDASQVLLVWEKRKLLAVWQK